MLTTTYCTFQQYGIPLGLIDHAHAAVYIAQDAFTRQHHIVTPNEFVPLGTGTWRSDPDLSHAFTGSVAMIDPPTQTVTHICDDDLTTRAEVANLEALIADCLMRMAAGSIIPPT